VEGKYNLKEEGSFKEKGKQNDQWAQEEGLMAGELGRRIVP